MTNAEQFEQAFIQMEYWSGRYHGWRIEADKDIAVITKGGEWIEIHTSSLQSPLGKAEPFGRLLQLAMNKVNRLNEEDKK